MLKMFFNVNIYTTKQEKCASKHKAKQFMNTVSQYKCIYLWILSVVLNIDQEISSQRQNDVILEMESEPHSVC